MRRLVSIVTICVLALAGACGTDSEDGGDGGNGGDRSQTSGDAGLDVCSLVSDDTVKDLQARSADEQSKPHEGLMRGAELFVECRINTGVDVGFAVRAAPGGPGLETLVEAAQPLDGIGDQAYIGDNSYDGVRIAARVGDHELIVNSDAYIGSSGDGISRDDMIAVAKEVASALGQEKPGAVRLPEACPPPSDPQVQKAVGATLVARGSASGNSWVECNYVSDARTLTLAAVAATGKFSAIAGGPDTLVEVDGDQAQFDTAGGINLNVGDTCVLRAESSPLGWAPADQRPESERREEAIELVRYVKESIGCP
ncbi:hypothetical protein [Aeromicrobium wangtongii]|uniref:DUF3558 domain-containing protein n=1 Tax=Aeromicrobium wangtongii TaxID=2969247 RepID=A0ABY5M6S8_9ACTN|nr:hypothetical protein [Aeromicrobium wangtongii]MCD9198372.1 hypothetical protein [Aeromicrobium wangtongii]UUP12403.1 hypothetical protein NQV15_11110 [Aeromicrobium wangtongii]